MEKKHLKIRNKNISKLIIILFTFPVVLTLLGLFFIFEASSVTSFRTYGDSFTFIKLQLGWFFVGFIFMLFFSFFNYRRLYFIAFPALLVTIVLLIIVLIPGIGTTVKGARRWISLGAIGFQPTEISKFSIILYLCSWFLYKEKNRFFSFFLLLLFVIGLIMIQPDLGTAVIIFSLFVIIHFISGEDIKYLLFLLPFSAMTFFALIKISPYRFSRLLSFLNPDIDKQGINYHANQIYISLVNGGLLGRGFSASRAKYQFLPEAYTDSIFAIVGEEIGFLGSLVVLCLYISIILAGFLVAFNAKDKFGKMLAGSISSLIALQTIINLGGIVNIFPLTGIPLPFFSYGGSSLVVFFALLGILVNIARSI